MTTFLNAIWPILAILLVPLITIQLLTESRREKARRLHRQGMSQRRIATEMAISRYRVCQLLTA